MSQKSFAELLSASVASMELPQCWKDLQSVCLSQKLLHAANACLVAEGEGRSKQKQVQVLLDNDVVEREDFESIFTDVDEDAESAELEVFVEVWKAEVKMALEEVERSKLSVLRSHLFSDGDVEAMSRFVDAKETKAMHLKRVQDLPSHAEDSEKEEARAALASAEDGEKTAFKIVQKSKRAKQCADRNLFLQSPKKRVLSDEERPEHAIERKRVPQSQDVGMDVAKVKDDSGVSGSFNAHLRDPADSEFGERTLASARVPVQAVLDGMLEDCVVEVKLLHLPCGISVLPVAYKSTSKIELYEAIVGCSGQVYDLTARGDMAHKALALLPRFRGEVVRLTHTACSIYKLKPHLSLMDGFEVESVDDVDRSMKQCTLQRVWLSKVTEEVDKTKVHLLPCMVTTSSETKFATTGTPYRSTRIADSRGGVTQVMIWGDLATTDELWAKNAIVDISAASVNRTDKRLDLRNSSCAELTAAASSFRLPNRLGFVPWN